MVPTIFATSRKKGHRPKWSLYRHESNKNKKYLSECNFRILFTIGFWKLLDLLGSKDRKYQYKLNYTVEPTTRQ